MRRVPMANAQELELDERAHRELMACAANLG